VEDITPPAQEEPTDESFQEDATEEPYEPEETPPMAEPEPPTEETFEPTPPLITDEGIVWIAPPIHEHDAIIYCGHCGIFVNSQRQIISTATGELLNDWGDGHGIGGFFLEIIYDPERHLLGEPHFGGGYDREFLGMYPFDEAFAQFESHGINLHGLYIVQAVDSTKRRSTGSGLRSNDERIEFWTLTDDAFLGDFAVMYNGEFITDFIFDEGFVWPKDDRIESDADTVAMSLEGMWGTIDNYGNVSIPFIFNHMRRFDGDRAVAVYEGNWGLIDRYGNILVPFLFDEIYHFGTGWCRYWIVAVYNGKHGLIDKSGNIVIPFFFDHIFGINGNTAFAKYDGLYGIIDIHQTIAHTAQQ